MRGSAIVLLVADLAAIAVLFMVDLLKFLADELATIGCVFVVDLAIDPCLITVGSSGLARSLLTTSMLLEEAILRRLLGDQSRSTRFGTILIWMLLRESTPGGTADRRPQYPSNRQIAKQHKSSPPA